MPISKSLARACLVSRLLLGVGGARSRPGRAIVRRYIPVQRLLWGNAFYAAKNIRGGNHGQLPGGLVQPGTVLRLTVMGPAAAGSKHEVQVRGQTVRYTVAGSGEPMILVHGLSGSTHWWRRNIPALAQHYQLYLVDLPGFGTMRRHRRLFVLAEAAAWLLDWMEAVNLQAAHLVGHSMGGYICLRLAACRPEAVRRLVLVAPAGTPIGRSLAGHLIPLLKEIRVMRPGFLPILVYDALRTGPLTLWRAASALLGEDVREHLAAISAPTLLVWGEHDVLVPAAIGYVLRGEIAGSRLLILEGAGHVPMFDHPDEFNAALMKFLAGEPVGE